MDFGMDQIQGLFDKLAKLPRAYRMALLPAIVALVVAGYVYTLYLPAKGTLEQTRDRHLQLQRQLSEVRSVAANEEAVKQEISVLERKLAVALRQLPDSKQLPVLLTDITSLGKAVGLDFRVFRPQAEVQREFYAEVPIEIEFTGRFHDVAMFFDEVARLPRIVNVGQLDVGIAKESTTDTVLEVKGNAVTFRFVEPKERPQGQDEGKSRRGRKAQQGRRGQG